MNLENKHPRLIKDIGGIDRLAVSYSQIETFMQCPHRWHKTYVENIEKDIKTEALEYGSAIHETLEWFFKNRCRPTPMQCAKEFEMRAKSKDIPFVDVASQLESMRDAILMIEWITGVFQKVHVDMSPLEKCLFNMRAIGIEEGFALDYKLPFPVTLDGTTYDNVAINGSIDLHLQHEDKHVVIDWKSGRKLFDAKKLQTNLQHPIYSMYIMRHYGNGLPVRNYYVFTRTQEYQKVNVDMERIKQSVSILSNTFAKMYDFESDENNKPHPSPLCYWCEHKDECEFKSDYHPKEKKTD